LHHAEIAGKAPAMDIYSKVDGPSGNLGWPVVFDTEGDVWWKTPVLRSLKP